MAWTSITRYLMKTTLLTTLLSSSSIPSYTFLSSIQSRLNDIVPRCPKPFKRDQYASGSLSAFVNIAKCHLTLLCVWMFYCCKACHLSPAPTTSNRSNAAIMPRILYSPPDTSLLCVILLVRVWEFVLMCVCVYVCIYVCVQVCERVRICACVCE